jgi:iron complex transport system permease protein
MSGFLSTSSRRLTGKRLAVTLALCALVCAVIVLVAPLVAVVITDKGPRHLEMLGLDAYQPGTPAHALLMLRLPRLLACLVIGAGLAGAGCALQALLRNPLAEPFTLGISSGASLATVIAIRLGVESWFGSLGVGGAAQIGAFGTLLLVYQLARVGRNLPPATLVLAGITLSMFCSSASLLIQYTSDFTDVLHMFAWMMGGLDSVRMGGVKLAAGPILVGLAILIAYARELNALAAGPEVAASLGVAVGRAQLVIFAASSLLVGAAIALGGPIGFVGLIVPHLLRGLLGSDHRLLLPASMFGGAALLAVCDTLARTGFLIFRPYLPTGAVTAVLGGPFFVMLLVRQKRHAALWGR